MSKSNREIRVALASVFGSGCMFRKSHAEQFVEKLGKITTYKKFKEEKHYTAKDVKRLEAVMTLHHLRHRSEGGPTTAENGAIVNELAHRYIHSLPRSQEEIINDYIREWKKRHHHKCEVEFVEDLEEPFEINLSEFYVGKQLKVQKFSRAKEKQKTKKLIDEYYECEK